jgi:chaperonin GroES
MEEYKMKLVPLGDKVVLKQLVAEETTKSGIVIPGQAKEKPQQAEVVAVGPGAEVDGKIVPMQVKVGDKVVFQTIVKQADILAIIED